MKPAFYQRQWQKIQADADSGALHSLARRIAASFVDRYFYSDEYNSEYVQLLCEMATKFDEPQLNQVAASALFGIVIERLCDDFEELQTETYNKLICQVVSILRKHPAGSELDTKLTAFGLHSEEQLYQRIESIRLSPDEKLAPSLSLKKVLILSRVTIGADVAITSIICQRAMQAFPDAEIVVIGNSKLNDVFAGNSAIRIAQLDYSRRGGLLERFLAWLQLLAAVQEELAGLGSADYVLLDPDSRLTQLGVLPLVADKNYRFFNSRGKQNYPVKASISELTNLWLDHVLGQSEFCYPKVWPTATPLAHARQVCAQLISNPDHKLITLNLGVGGNQRKRVSDEFEVGLIISLLQDTKLRLVLDLGFGHEERARSEKILAAAKAAGFATAQISMAHREAIVGEVRLLGVESTVAEIAALISYSDEFIGYDSACQHIAAAQGVKTFTVFAGSNNARFIRRWHACGPNASEIVYVDTLSRDRDIDNNEIIARLQELRLED